MKKVRVKTEDELKLVAYKPEPILDYIQRKVDNDIEFWSAIDKETKLPRKCVALVGESGSGKTYSVSYYASKHDLPCLIVPCDNSMILKELLGYWKAEGGTTFWCEGLLAQFLRHPCVVLFDEVNCLPGSGLFMLHELLQNRKLFVKDAPKDDQLISLNPEARVFIAMNPPEAKYSGTNRLNTALANRLVFIDVKPFDADEILTITTGKKEVDEQIIQFYRDMVKVIRDQKLRVSISKRNIDAICAAVRDGLDIGTAVSQAFINSALSTASLVEREALLKVAVPIFGAENFKELAVS